MIVGCNKYDDDIEDLKGQVSAVRTTVEQLQALVNSGSVITDVTSGNGGVTITLSNGKQYVISGGKDGADGKDADVWTIGSDGFWYKNGAKTEYKAIGVDGVAGAKGDQGDKGDNGDKGDKGDKGDQGDKGDNGFYYVPNPETGCFDIYKDGEFVEKTDISWKPSADEIISAVQNGNTITFYGGNFPEEGLTIILGHDLGSVAFIPDAINADSHYPHVSFYRWDSYYKEDFTVATTPMKKSNEVSLEFRLNPADAYISADMQAGYIHRDVIETRAAKDQETMLTILDNAIFDGGKVTVKTGLKTTAEVSNKDNDFDFEALQVWQGQDYVTSDYIHITASGVEPTLVNTTTNHIEKNGTTVVTPDDVFYDRFRTALPSPNFLTKDEDSDEQIKAVAGTVEAKNFPAHFFVKYDDANGLDLSEKVALYEKDLKKFFDERGLGFTGISYEFSLPKEYLAEDEMKTNQQYFVELEGAVVKVVRGTSAINRLPVVRVDAYVEDFDGVKRWVASAYIKIQITADDVKPDEQGDLEVKIEGDEYVVYNNLSYDDGQFPGKDTHRNDKNYGEHIVAEMPWENFNADVYDALGLTAKNFWDYFGGDENQYNVTINSGKYVIADETLFATNRGEVVSGEGIQLTLMMNGTDAQTTSIHVAVSDQIHTQHVFTVVDKKEKPYEVTDDGVEYTVTITIPADNNYLYKNVVMTHTFYVKHDCAVFDLNPLYLIEGSDKVKDNGRGIVVVEGENTPDGWELFAKIIDHFGIGDAVNNFDEDQNVFDYCTVGGNKENLKSIEFWMKSQVDDKNNANPEVEIVDGDNAAGMIQMVDGEIMSVQQADRIVNYAMTLDNGETCEAFYTARLRNPFVGEKGDDIVLDGRSPRTAATDQNVLVVDKYGDAIVIYDEDAEELVLTELAAGTALGEYGLSEFNVEYSFKEDASYKEFVKLLGETEETYIKIDEATGEIELRFNTAIQKTYQLTVIAKVTVLGTNHGYSVECEIPVKVLSTK